MSRSNPTTALLGTATIVLIAGYALGRIAKLKSTTTPIGSIPIERPVSSSSQTYVCRILPTQCDHEHGRAYGGEVVMLLDVAAGLTAAKHAASPCLTISLDRVTFLQPIAVGDVLKISTAVNRAWGSSLEIGVRVVKEATDVSKEVYCCHAYFTFVKIKIPPPPPSTFTSIAQSLRLLPPTPLPKNQVPTLVTSTNIEMKRYLLAGRRRAHRLANAKSADSLFASLREQLLAFEEERKKKEEGDSAESVEEKAALLLTLQKELIVEAYIRQDSDVKVEGDQVVTTMEGFVDEIRMPLAEVEKLIAMKGKGGYRRLTVSHTDPNDDEERGGGSISRRASITRMVQAPSPVDLVDTSAMSCWIVRPQHCNSKNILFGGQLIRFSEEVASISARRISISSWLTASIDSLSFKSAVYPGEVVYVRAWVINTYDSSVEIFTLVTAEDRNASFPQTRLVSEAFFTLVGIDLVSKRPMKGKLRKVRIPDGPVREVAENGNKRREERLQDKRLLERVYA